ncbi:hypothetical protein V1478_017992 [Vespula squamosa]|uniref:Uncharacterized protein n=1 Tax=Vespula squamosa TaxID=30214 RepID=A0ABD1ZVS6_VESSQ
MFSSNILILNFIKKIISNICHCNISFINARTANAAIIVNAVTQVPERNVVAVARQPAIAFARPANVNYDLT